MLDHSLLLSESNEPHIDFRNSLEDKINTKLEKLGISKMRGASRKVQGSISIIKQSADYQGSGQSNHVK